MTDVPRTQNPILRLRDAGQSVWLDYIRRRMLEDGELERLMAEDALAGMTSNPAIFEQAIGGCDDYDAAIATLAREGRQAQEIYAALTHGPRGLAGGHAARAQRDCLRAARFRRLGRDPCRRALAQSQPARAGHGSGCAGDIAVRRIGPARRVRGQRPAGVTAGVRSLVFAFLSTMLIVASPRPRNRATSRCR